jgi:hypothetical protein
MINVLIASGLKLSIDYKILNAHIFIALFYPFNITEEGINT